MTGWFPHSISEWENKGGEKGGTVKKRDIGDGSGLLINDKKIRAFPHMRRNTFFIYDFASNPLEKLEFMNQFPPIYFTSEFSFLHIFFIWVSPQLTI
jgi:hypothetical protein